MNTLQTYFVCDFCEEVFARQDELAFHRKSFRSQQGCAKYLTRSSNCKSFVTYERVPKLTLKIENDSHVQPVPSQKELRCSGCGLFCTSKAVLHEHRKDKQFTCNICCKQFLTIACAVSHGETHVRAKSNSRCSCNRIFCTQEYLDHHEEIHSRGWVRDPYVCESCGSKFFRSSSYFHHKVTHTDKKLSVCTNCHEVFATKADLLKHQILVSPAQYGSDKYIVPGTNQTSRGENANCSTSGNQQTSTKIAVQENYQASMKERTYNITSDCLPKPLESNVHLALNRRTSTLRNSLQCSTCGSIFANNSDLIYHQMIHTKKKPDVCSICHEAFAQKFYLRDHYRISHGVSNPVDCITCCQLFANEIHLENHAVTHVVSDDLYQSTSAQSQQSHPNDNGHEYSASSELSSHPERPLKCVPCIEVLFQRMPLPDQAALTGEKQQKRATSCQVFDESPLVNENPLKCTACNETFDKDIDLIMHHQESHLFVDYGQSYSEEIPLICVTAAELPSGSASPSNKNLHKVPAYEATFAKATDLQKHSEQYRSKEKSQECATSNQLSTKSVHPRGDLIDENPFTCAFCKSRFTHAIDLEWHHEQCSKGKLLERSIPDQMSSGSFQSRRDSRKKPHKRASDQVIATSSQTSDDLIGENPFKCAACKAMFAKATDLLRHCEQYHSKKKPRSRTTPSQVSSERNHSSDEFSVEMPFVCIPCKEMFAKATDLISHYLEEHRDTNLLEPSTSGQLLYEMSQLMHVREVRSDNERLECTVCSKTFDQENDLLIHCQLSHPKEGHRSQRSLPKGGQHSQRSLSKEEQCSQPSLPKGGQHSQRSLSKEEQCSQPSLPKGGQHSQRSLSKERQCSQRSLPKGGQHSQRSLSKEEQCSQLSHLKEGQCSASSVRQCVESANSNQSPEKCSDKKLHKCKVCDGVFARGIDLLIHYQQSHSKTKSHEPPASGRLFTEGAHPNVDPVLNHNALKRAASEGILTEATGRASLNQLSTGKIHQNAEHMSNQNPNKRAARRGMLPEATGRAFSGQLGTKNIRLSHTEEKQMDKLHRCLACGEMFPRGIDLLIHIQQSHIKDKTYEAFTSAPMFTRSVHSSHQNAPADDSEINVPTDDMLTDEVPTDEVSTPLEWGDQSHGDDQIAHSVFKQESCSSALNELHPDNEPRENISLEGVLAQPDVLRQDERSLGRAKAVYPCPDCNKIYHYQSRFNIHRMLHKSNWAHRCAECRRRFRFEYQLLAHQQMVHIANPLEWSDQSHRNDHSANEPRENISSEEVQPDVLRRGERSLGRAKEKYPCPDCGKIYQYRSRLKVHRMLHRLSWAHRCPDCGRRFRDESHLLIHQRKVHIPKPYKCLECGKEFLTRGNFKFHSYSHKSQKVLACSVCGERFWEHKLLINHQRKHNSNYACKPCGKRFIRKVHFQNHMRTRHGVDRRRLAT